MSAKPVGFVPLRRHVDINVNTGPWAGFKCSILIATQAELDAIRDAATFTDLAAAMAPLIVSWNYADDDPTTGGSVIRPAPAVAGPSALAAVEISAVRWLRQIILNADWHKLAGNDPPSPSNLDSSQAKFDA